MTFRPLTPEEHAALYAEMQRPAVPGYADEPPEELGWRERVRDLLSFKRRK